MVVSVHRGKCTLHTVFAFCCREGNWPTVFATDVLDAQDTFGHTPHAHYTLAVRALGAIIWYLRQSFMDADLLSMRNVQLYHAHTNAITGVCVGTLCICSLWIQGDVALPRLMILDESALRHLNIVPLADTDEPTRRHSLFTTVDKCSTAFGELSRQRVCMYACVQANACYATGFAHQCVAWRKSVIDRHACS
jgi:DNA mismatch repair protein MSH6